MVMRPNPVSRSSRPPLPRPLPHWCGHRLFSSCFPHPNQGSPQLFGLLIGIDHYKDTKHFSIGKNHGSVADAERFGKFLYNTLSVPKENIQVLLDNSATRVAIIAALKQLRDDERIHPGDAIFISFSGYTIGETYEHFPGENIPAIAPHDWCEDPGQEISGIPLCAMGGLIESIAKVKGNNITVVLDCNSAASGIVNPNSHVLLAACGASGIARERKGHGLFSHALLTVLQSNDALKLTYSDIMQKTVDLMSERNQGSDQYPQCLGLHRNRYFFSYDSCEDSHVPPDPIRYTFRDGENFVLNGGSAHGLTVGDEFLVFPDTSSISNAPLGTLMIDVVESFAAHLKLPEGVRELRGFSNKAVAIKSTKIPKAVLKLALPPYQHVMFLHSIFKSPRRPFQNIISTTPDEANLSIFWNNNSDDFSIQVTDPRVAKYGTTPWLRNGDPIVPAKLPDVLETALEYYWELERTDSSDKFPLQHIQVKFYELHYVESLFIKGEQEAAPAGPNLYQYGEVHLRASDSGSRSMYGIKITNYSDVDVHLYINYFYPDELSIETVYEPPSPMPDGHEAPPSLRRADIHQGKTQDDPGVLTIGYGFAGCPPLVLPMLKDNEAVHVGFIKIFLFAMDYGRPDKKASRAWSTIVIPVVQHRGALAQAPP